MVLDSEVFTLTPIPGKPGEIWATTCGWVYRTLDRGGRWERFKDGFEERRTPSFAALPDGRLLAGTVAGLHVSADGGRTWTNAKFSQPPQPFCWRLWKADVQVTPATKALLARATDSSGTTQPKEVPWNLKGYMYNAWYRAPLKVRG
jgi:hypothetical protein